MLFLVLLGLICPSLAYDPTWASLDKRPLPLWYDEAKFGIFMHWGVYSVPAFRSEWFWWYWQGNNPDPKVVAFMEANYRKGFSYADFGPLFTAEFFNATDIAAIVKASGAKYFVPTSKHHEGYTMWPSKYSWNWNSVDVGPGRDLIGELRNATLAEGGVHFGLYFSQFEWFNRLFTQDAAEAYKTNQYVRMVSQPQLQELVAAYKPDVIWSDGDWGATPEYWNSTAFLAWLYNSSPVKDRVCVNDRWGVGTAGKHGDFFNHADKYNPGYLLPHKWENAMTLDTKSWGYRRRMESGDVLSVKALIQSLASTVACGGNMLLNVGPTHYGRLVPIFEQRLRDVGAFLSTNAEAVYGTKPWVHQNDTLTKGIWYTSRMRSDQGLDPRRINNPQEEGKTIVFAWLTEWPASGLLRLGAPKSTAKTTVSLIGLSGQSDAGPIRWKFAQNQLQIDLSGVRWTTLPSTTAWVLKLEYLASSERDPLLETAKMLAKSGIAPAA